MKPQSDMA